MITRLRYVIFFSIPLWTYPADNPAESALALAQALGDLGQHYTKYNKHELAAPYLKTALEMNDMDTLAICAAQEIRQGNFTTARAYVARMADEAEPYRSILRALLDALQTNNLEQAIKYVSQYRHILEGDEPSEHWLARLADAWSHVGKYEWAEICYLKSLEHGIYDEMYTEIGKFYKKQGNLIKAKEYYERAFLQQTDAGEYNSGILALGTIYYRLEDLDTAEQFFRKEDIASFSKAREYLARIACRRGDIKTCTSYLTTRYRDKKLPDNLDLESVNAFITEQKEYSQRADCLENVGLAYFETKQFDLALSHLLESTRIEQTYNTTPGVITLRPGIEYALAKMYRKRGNCDDAESIYKKYLTYNYACAGAFYGLGKIAESKKEYQTAASYYTQCLDCSPDEQHKPLKALINISKLQANKAAVTRYQKQLDELESE